MNREFKFRVWQEHYDTPRMCYSDEDPRLTAFFSMQGTENLMQFTGLKDKNNNEVYEGDLVRQVGGEVYEIVWCPLVFGWVYMLNREFQYDFNDIPGIELEVIGNIYGTPELLK